MKTRRLTELSLLTAAALIIFIVELRFPDILPIPGVKPGLANIITVYAVYRFSAGETALMLTSRVVLGAIFTSNLSALIYSATGAVFCLIGMLLVRRMIPMRYIWLCSIIGAILHNTGQTAAALAVTGSWAVLAYYPILIVVGTIAGLFTGSCAQFIINRTGVKK